MLLHMAESPSRMPPVAPPGTSHPTSMAPGNQQDVPRGQACVLGYSGFLRIRHRVPRVRYHNHVAIFLTIAKCILARYIATNRSDCP